MGREKAVTLCVAHPEREPSMDTWIRDVRYGWRLLTTRLGLSLFVIATLGTGIGIISTLFSFVNSGAFRAPVYPGASRLVALGAMRKNGPRLFSGLLSLGDVQEIRAARTLRLVGVYRERPARLVLPSEESEVAVTEVDANVFRLLASRPAMGRIFDDDEARQRQPVAVISDSLWHVVFNGSPQIVGRSLKMDDFEVTIIGVMPPGFRFAERSNAWVPLGFGATDAGWLTARSFSALAELREAATPQEVRDELALMSSRLAAADPGQHGGWSFIVQDEIVDRHTHDWLPFALLLIGAGVCTLLVVCTNIANVMLGRAVERRWEMAVRASLGASRSQLIRQSLVESGLLASLGGVVAIGLTAVGIRVITALLPSMASVGWIQWGIDWRVMVVAMSICLLALFSFGLLPAIEATRVDIANALKTGTEQAGADPVTSGRGGAVTIVELAIATIIMVSAVLLDRTYDRVSRIDPGFQPGRVLEIVAGPGPLQFSSAAKRRELVERIRSRALSIADSGDVAIEGAFRGIRGDSAAQRLQPVAPDMTNPIAGRPPIGTTELDYSGLFLHEAPNAPVPSLRPALRLRVVSREYFRVLGLPVVIGRGFGASDDRDAPPVVVITSTLAQSLWPGQSPIGRMLQIGRRGTPLTVIGVTHDVRDVMTGAFGISARPVPIIFFADRQAALDNAHILSRISQLDTGAARRRMSAALASVAFGRDRPTLQNLAAIRAAELTPIRLVGLIMLLFAMGALGLAMLGVYGVTGLMVAQRQREFAIRMVAGAQRSDIIGAVMRRGARLALTGILVGLVGGSALVQIMRRFLWGVTPLEAITIILVGATVATTSLLAAYRPASRASRVDLAIALRGR